MSRCQQPGDDKGRDWDRWSAIPKKEGMGRWSAPQKEGINLTFFASQEFSRKFPGSFQGGGMTLGKHLDNKFSGGFQEVAGNTRPPFLGDTWHAKYVKTTFR